ncbi:MAG TPA: NAD-dependent epimerase/dehydratase family protein [Thermoleophilaceae bacterium]|jgi:nucleoside-diphosphate-sugar epimerase
MTRALVTGATGKVGGAVARALLERGEAVRALVRDPARAAELLPTGVELARGDVTEPASVAAAVAGCELVFNAMGFPEQWLRDESVFDRVNARGTETVVRAAAAAGVRRLVHTSTIDVFHAERGTRFDESRVADYPKGTAYERSKQRAEELALAVPRGGMELVICNPAGVYGPTPASSVSLDGEMFAPLIRRRLPALPPGGLGVCFDAGVARGHLLAAERGRDGERYILCDRHATLRELAESVVRVAGRGRVPPSIPEPLARALAAGGEALARAFGVPPLLARGQLHFFLWNAAPDSTKAQDELGWEPTALDDGLRAAIAALGRDVRA